MQKTHTTTRPLEHVNETASERTGVCLLIAGGVLLGTIGVFVEEANQHPLVTVWFRCVFGALALLIFALIVGRVRELRLDGRGYRIAVSTGLLMITNWALFFAAITKTSIAVATVVFHVQPLWVMLFGILFLREAFSTLRLLATATALAGLTLTTGLVGDTYSVVDIGADYYLGIAMCLGGSLSYAAVTIIAKTERQVSSFALAWWQCAVGSVVLMWSPVMFGWPQNESAWLWLAGLGLIHTGLAYVILFAGMNKLSLGNVALLQFVYPLTAVLIDWAVYGRVLQPIQIAGVVLMSVALWTVRKPAGNAPVPR